ncbi:MAG: kinase/pyrophosphorylase [Rhodobiaceae bacterium]|jgi:regulator of PEP synthase PpsR (kinase-PPPase family)|nr:kinase/pyrophosphorylase [Rhodobiaceae bacterium]MBT6222379.1 kinase/pyrophosphorylase [Rhodobiaceae bacterium]MDC3272031.1 kinase/pyrophosphorylase [Hyphomicrobiales bacterium]|tara:strand:+ start:491 stop:1333 length:843 start_codon:yes stop_codon:yes gene_type:complete
MEKKINSSFHIHLVSDSTGETLNVVSKAVIVQYRNIESIEHVYPLVRSIKQLDNVIKNIEKEPGIVFFTLSNLDLRRKLEVICKKLNLPIVAPLDKVHEVLNSYIDAEWSPKVGAQHVLDTEYFKRIEAMNYTMANDDGRMTGNLSEADIILVGVSRTSKTPTSIYLANHGMKTANVPFVLDIPLPDDLEKLKDPLIVGLIASPERIVQIRKNRLESLNAGRDSSYVDKDVVSREIILAKRLFARNNWPVIDVTRRSIEETAAAIMNYQRSRNSEKNDKS